MKYFFAFSMYVKVNRPQFFKSVYPMTGDVCLPRKGVFGADT